MVLALNRTFDTHLITPSRGQRTATFTFELIDGVTNQSKRFLTPLKSATPSLSHDTTRTITRSVSNLSFSVTDTAAINVIRDRVLISMVIGSDVYPLGRYMFIDQSRVRHTFGLLSSVSLVDEMFIVDQPLIAGFSASNVAGRGDVVAERLLSRYPVETDIEPSTYQVVGSWSVGTSGAKVLGDIALDGNFMTPWFAHDGKLHMIQSFDVPSRIPDIDWDENNSIMQGTITETDDLINAPNQFVVVANGGVDLSAPVIGIAEVPASAPHSIQNRGFVVPDVRELQVSGATHAAAIALNLVRRQVIVERTELSTAPDPRHDSHQVIRWQGENWLEIAWSMELVEGGKMRHVLAKRYS